MTVPRKNSKNSEPNNKFFDQRGHLQSGIMPKNLTNKLPPTSGSTHSRPPGVRQVMIE